MKRYGNLYDNVASVENIAIAHAKAKRGKSHYDEVRMVEGNPERYFEEIHHSLLSMTFRNSEYEVFLKTDGPKEREIWKLPYYPDRIVHHCIVNVLEPIWIRSMIRDTYSAIPRRGVHDGVRRIRKALQSDSSIYCLKMDVKKFYQSIDHEILKQQIRKKIKDSRLLWLLDEIINSAPGVPIGNYIKKKNKKNRDSLPSYNGWFVWANTHNLRKKYACL